MKYKTWDDLPSYRISKTNTLSHQNSSQINPCLNPGNVPIAFIINSLSKFGCESPSVMYFCSYEINNVQKQSYYDKGTRWPCGRWHPEPPFTSCTSPDKLLELQLFRREWWKLKSFKLNLFQKCISPLSASLFVADFSGPRFASQWNDLITT